MEGRGRIVLGLPFTRPIVPSGDDPHRRRARARTAAHMLRQACQLPSDVPILTRVVAWTPKGHPNINWDVL